MALTVDMRLTGRDIATLLLGGVAGLELWELFTGVFAPLVLGFQFSPIPLVGALFQTLFGENPGRPVNMLVHHATGIVFYPIGFVVLVTIAGAIGLRFAALVWGIIWGGITWFLALGVFAPITGAAFLLGYGNLTWASLAGHLIYAITAVGVFAALRR